LGNPKNGDKLMKYNTRIYHNIDDNADEIFWQRLSGISIPEEFVPIIESLDYRGTLGVYIDPELAKEFEKWISQIQDHENKPLHANTSLLFHKNETVEERDYDEEDNSYFIE